MRRGFFGYAVAAALVLALASGCSPTRSRIPDRPVEVPGAFSGASGDRAQRIVGRWWERFGDPVLDSLMEEALAANLGVAGAWERVGQARALVGAERSALFPRLDVTASRGRIKQRAISGVGPSITTDTYRLSAAAGYEIDLWRKLGSRTRAAGLEARATGEDLKTLYISLSAEVADLYFLIVEQRAQLELTDRTIEAFEDTLARVERRYRAGLVPALDVYQSRQNLAGARAQRPIFAANLEVAEHALSVLMGRAPGKVPPVAPTGLADPPDFAAGLPSDLLTRRPDLRAAFLRLAAADKRVAAAVADRFPSFNLTGELGGASTKLT
ncbi:MAG: TolC family protein, partial [Thermodesulfobacteriota bacterium]